MKCADTKILNTRIADTSNVVHTIVGGSGAYRRKPCAGCPWRRSNACRFPAEAFRHAVNTAYDGAQEQFGCHESSIDRPATCAGFLLRNAANNIGTRLAILRGDIDMDALEDPGAELFSNYREMAIANGVDRDDPVLGPCRADHELGKVRP